MNLSPEVQDMCRQVGKVLAKYRSGPLPKMFKVIPKMRSWEELVYLTSKFCYEKLNNMFGYCFVLVIVAHIQVHVLYCWPYDILHNLYDLTHVSCLTMSSMLLKEIDLDRLKHVFQ